MHDCACRALRGQCVGDGLPFDQLGIGQLRTRGGRCHSKGAHPALGGNEPACSRRRWRRSLVFADEERVAAGLVVPRWMSTTSARGGD